MDKVAWWSWEIERLQSCTMCEAELHCFSDASNHGYGIISHLRVIAGQNSANVAFIVGKARVAPLMQTTIPRLELTAAVLAVRVDKMLRIWNWTSKYLDFGQSVNHCLNALQTSVQDFTHLWLTGYLSLEKTQMCLNGDALELNKIHLMRQLVGGILAHWWIAQNGFME